MNYSHLKYFFIIPLFFSCSKNKDAEQTIPTFNEHYPVKQESITSEKLDPVKLAAEGKVLVEGADCMSCHQISEKMIGPSYKDVAKKYSEKDVDLLVDKIINGGSGNWGNIPMAAHNGLSKENSRKMVYYILSLK